MMEHAYDDKGACWCGPQLVQPHKEEEGHPQQYGYGWRHHYDGHVCCCPNCASSSFIITGTTWDVENAIGEHPHEVALDGEKLPSVLRFREGQDGWAVFLSREGAGKVHACESCFGAGCQKMLHGHVTALWGERVSA